MIVVIQCAGRKRTDAGHLIQSDGRNVMFVGSPSLIPNKERKENHIYAHPDDLADTGQSWRDELLRYNEEPNDNPFRLLPAWKLYRNPTYALLKEKYGTDSLFILSAGWGLISASFLTPNYDITFSTSKVDKYKRRRPNDRFNDLNQLPIDYDEPAVFFVCPAYIPLASRLIDRFKGPCYLFKRSQDVTKSNGFIPREYETSVSTNWHYTCAKDFAVGKIGI